MIDPSWIDDEGVPITGADTPARVWWRRAVTAELVPMPEGGPEANGARVLERLCAVGRRRLALAAQAASSGAAAALAARLGPPHGALLVEEARAAAPREELRAAVRELADLPREASATALLLRAAARHLAPALARAGLLVPLAQRLPRPLGLALIEEGRGPVVDDGRLAAFLKGL